MTIAESANNLAKFLVVAGCVFAGVGVVAGAAGAHGLDKILAAEKIDVFRTGVLYHLIHALGLISMGAVLRSTSRPVLLEWMAALAMMLGIVCFSGSLYVFALLDVKYITRLTPLGGTLLILSWFIFAIAVFRRVG